VSHPKILYVLECDHIMPGPIGALVLDCYNCGGVARIVADVHVWEWIAFCATCRFRSWCGLSQALAQTTIASHARRKHHVGKTLYMKNPYAERYQKKYLS